MDVTVVVLMLREKQSAKTVTPADKFQLYLGMATVNQHSRPKALRVLSHIRLPYSRHKDS